MEFGGPVLWIIGLPAIGLVFLLWHANRNYEHRERRRRLKSHRPVVSSKPGPGVKFAVNVGGRKRRRKP